MTAAEIIEKCAEAAWLSTHSTPWVRLAGNMRADARTETLAVLRSLTEAEPTERMRIAGLTALVDEIGRQRGARVYELIRTDRESNAVFAAILTALIEDADHG